MNLESQLRALKNQSSDLTLAERADLSCRLAKQLEKAGEYEAAYDALSEFWPDRNSPPKLDGLDEATRAEVLLRVGNLAGWQGSANQVTGSQETAKDRITRSLEIFEQLGQSEKTAEARGDLALCYWREGSYDEARIHLENALGLLGNQNSDLRAILLIRAGIVEVWALRLNEALRFYNEAAPLVELSEDHALKGSFHIEFGLVFRRLAAPENREDYLDRALIEYAAASFHFEQAGNDRYLARVENNLGYLYFTIGRYKDAHYHLDRARYLFLELKDVGTAAQVDETRARTLLAEGRVIEAERMVRSAVKTLETGGQQAVLAEALTTQGIVLARLGNHPRAKVVLERAIEVAETTGDLEGAGRAKLSIIEELGEKIPAKELVSIYRSAIDLLKRSQDPSTGKRLISCAAALLDVLGLSENEDLESLEHTWEGFSFKRQVLKYEKALIERALRDAGGSVTRAARLLGFNHHQSLISLINSRHKDLLKTRTAVRKRRRHLFSEPRKIKKKLNRASSEVCVLHVEDNKTVARLIQDTLASKGVYVDSCSSGTTALEILKTDVRYDVLIVDNDLPGLSGLELVLRVRSMARRRGTPIIMLSADNCEREAWRAGVDAFLRKPDSVDQVSSTIDRLLKERKEKRK
jgi:two-component system, OmpR family, phosphate regulon response regulator PhoB